MQRAFAVIIQFHHWLGFIISRWKSSVKAVTGKRTSIDRSVDRNGFSFWTMVDSWASAFRQVKWISIVYQDGTRAPSVIMGTMVIPSAHQVQALSMDQHLPLVITSVVASIFSTILVSILAMVTISVRFVRLHPNLEIDLFALGTSFKDIPVRIHRRNGTWSPVAFHF